MVPRFHNRRLSKGPVAALRRLAWRVGDRLRRIWWRIAQPHIHGSAVALFDEAGAILLIRHSYGSGRWSLPGGGIGRGEDPLEAARRECLEETGLAPRELRQAGVIESRLFGAHNHVHLFAGRVDGEPRIDGVEIVAAGYFALHDLPADLASRAGSWIARASAAYNKSS